MTEKTNELGMSWIKACNISGSHPCDEARFKDFVDSMKEENYDFCISDISRLLNESNQASLPDDIKDEFAERWYQKYEAMK